MTEIEKLPCPFCGESWTMICETRFEDRPAYAVTCRTRDCHGVIFSLGFGLFETREQAVEAWNQRAPSPTTDPAEIIADLLSATLMPTGGTWESARDPYVWEREGLNYLHARIGDRPPINAWTAWIVEEGYPPAKAGTLHGKFWKPPTGKAA